MGMGGKRSKQALFYAALSIVMLVFLAPYLWLVIQSLQTNAELADVPPQIRPHHDPFINYKVLLFYQKPEKEAQMAYQAAVPPFARFIPRSLLNTLIVSLGTTLLTLATCCAPAYAFARLRFRFRDQLMFSFLALRTFPIIIVMVPLFVMIQKVGLMDNVLALILTYSGFMIPYAIWMLSTYFQTLPVEVEESAIIDGCNRIQVIQCIVLPLARPGLAATGIFIALVSWNEFLLAAITTQSQASYTLPVIVSMFTQQIQMTPFDLMIAAGVIGSIIPVIIVLCFERYIVAGLTMGALKG